MYILCDSTHNVAHNYSNKGAMLIDSEITWPILYSAILTISTSVYITYILKIRIIIRSILSWRGWCDTCWCSCTNWFTDVSYLSKIRWVICIRRLKLVYSNHFVCLCKKSIFETLPIDCSGLFSVTWMIHKVTFQLYIHVRQTIDTRLTRVWLS